jgi:hypothetical protein
VSNCYLGGQRRAPGWASRRPGAARRDRLPGDRIIFGAAALPEPERDWLAAAERLPIESIWQGATSSRGTRPAKRSPASPC